LVEAYYCFLNATKALLLTKGATFSDHHGVSGFTIGGQTSLSNEKVKFKRGGILPALCQHLGETANGEIYTLKDLLYNLLSKPKIVRSMTTHESWLCAELTDKFANQHTINKLPAGFERERSVQDKWLIRARRRFDWRPNQRPASLNRYRNYHKILRKDLYYINGGSRLWYIKRGGNINGIIPRSSMTITFAAMHKLSEMARYTPDKLARHFDCPE